MHKIDTFPTVLTKLSITISPEEFTGKIKAGASKQNIVDCGSSVALSLGHSSRFIDHAEHAPPYSLLQFPDH